MLKNLEAWSDQTYSSESFIATFFQKGNLLGKNLNCLVRKVLNLNLSNWNYLELMKMKLLWKKVVCINFRSLDVSWSDHFRILKLSATKNEKEYGKNKKSLTKMKAKNNSLCKWSKEFTFEGSSLQERTSCDEFCETYVGFESRGFWWHKTHWVNQTQFCSVEKQQWT